VDFPQPAGSSIKAIADGHVVAVAHRDDLGWLVVLRHERSTADRLLGRKPVFSGYCHMSLDPGLPVGLAVKRGATIGHVGRQGLNGSEAAGEHLHLTMGHSASSCWTGEVFDPVKFIKRYSSVPAAPKVYTVKPGDNLTTIAKRNRTSVANLVALNGVRNPDLIHPGQRLRLS
jgi:murein DD-endopeptidase MepM/ murein hydrolase activator NlpD